MESSTASSRLQSGSATDVEVSDETLIPIGWVPRSDLPIVLVAVLGSICWMLVALRVFTRSVILKRLGWDDYTMIITLVKQSWRGDYSRAKFCAAVLLCVCDRIPGNPSHCNWKVQSIVEKMGVVFECKSMHIPRATY